MAGAAERGKRQKALVWWGAMMPHLKEPPGFEAFTGYKPDRAEQIRRWVEAWDKIDRALARN
jgi:hypothetical protein